MATVTGSSFGDFQAYFEYSTETTNTTYKVEVTSAGFKQNCTWSSYPWKTILEATKYDDRSDTIGTATRSAGYHGVLTTDKTYSWSRKTSAYKVTIKATTKKNISGGSSGSVSKTFTIPALASYTVTYKANGGSGAPAADKKYYGKTLTLSSTKPTRSGYTFVGWGTSSSDTSVAYKAGASYTSNSPITLYAIWKKEITLTYNANGGNGAPSSSSVTIYNAKTSYEFTLKSEPTTPKKGYTFVGWSKSNTSTSGSKPGATITLSSSDTLYAIWKKEIKITYNANGGSGAPDAVSKTVYNATTSYTFTMPGGPTTPKANCDFLGWSTSSTATSASYSTNEKVSFSTSDTLYAVWKLKYTPPITSLYARRVDANGKDDDEGVHGKVRVAWTAGKLAGVVQAPTITVSYRIKGSDNDYSTVYTYTSTTSDAKGTAETPAFVLNDINGSTELSQETQYDIRVVITDNANSKGTPFPTFISKVQFIIDINEDGTGISFGSPCARTGISSSWNMYLDNNKRIYGQGSDGYWYSLAYMGETDNSQFGYGGYYSGFGTAYYNGNTVYIRSKNDIYMEPKNTVNISGSCSTTSSISAGSYIFSGTNIYLNSGYRLRGIKSGDGALSVDNSNIVAGILEDNNRVLLGAALNSAPTEIRSPSVIYLKCGGTTSDESRYTLKLTYDTISDVTYGYLMPGYNTNGGTSYTNLGGANHKWRNVYATNGTIATSDRNLKRDIKYLSDKYLNLFDLLQPVSYKMIEGDRTHIGFIAQDVEDAMNTVGLSAEDFAGLCKDIKYIKNEDGDETPLINDSGEYEYLYSLRYSEFIPIAIAKIKQLEKEIKELKGE